MRVMIGAAVPDRETHQCDRHMIDAIVVVETVCPGDVGRTALQVEDRDTQVCQGRLRQVHAWKPRRVRRKEAAVLDDQRPYPLVRSRDPQGLDSAAAEA